MAKKPRAKKPKTPKVEAPKEEKEQKEIGRPTAFKSEYVAQVTQLCALGATDVDIAQFFNVSDRTIYRWRHAHPAFCQALKAAKACADDRVERSLYHRACGYSHEAVKIFMPAGAEKPVYAQYREYVPPDPTAAIFWLKNRRPEQWRDKTEIEHAHATYVIGDEPQSAEDWERTHVTAH